MRAFRDRNELPDIDLNRLASNLAAMRQREVELQRTILRLNREMPGNAEAIAAAGVAFRASINRSASMIELGTAAVEALRIAGYAIAPPAPPRTPRQPAEVDQRPKSDTPETMGVPAIPDDWTA